MAASTAVAVELECLGVEPDQRRGHEAGCGRVDHTRGIGTSDVLGQEARPESAKAAKSRRRVVSSWMLIGSHECPSDARAGVVGTSERAHRRAASATLIPDDHSIVECLDDHPGVVLGDGFGPLAVDVDAVGFLGDVGLLEVRVQHEAVATRRVDVEV